MATIDDDIFSSFGTFGDFSAPSFDFSNIGGGDFGTPDFSVSDFGIPQFSPTQFSPSVFSQAPQSFLGQQPSLGLLGAGLGALGPLAGLIGNLAGGGVQQRVTPQQTTAQKALNTQAQQSLGLLSPFAAGQTPLQQQQAAILNPLSGFIQQLLGGGGPGVTGLINTLTPLIQQSFDPFVQGLQRQATEAGRRAGFTDAPGTSPPGGAILGPGLAQLQGQQAQALLQALFQQIPNAAIQSAGAFNQPVNQQIGAAGNQASGFNNLFANFPTGRTVSAPLGPSIGAGIGTVLGGAAQGFNTVSQQQQQQQFNNSLLNAIQGLSGTRPEGL